MDCIAQALPLKWQKNPDLPLFEANIPEARARFPFLDFFAGSGLVSYALKPWFTGVWANDICPKKAAIFRANHPDAPFRLGSITEARGRDLPFGRLSWASFPCQDLSLAGKEAGIRAARSGLVWEWLRVMDETPKKPRLLVAENVGGLASSAGGAHYRELHQALAKRGYKVGAILLDAAMWLPQSRRRVFVVAIQKEIAIPPGLVDTGPNWAHPGPLAKLAQGLDNWIWWRMPQPANRVAGLSSLLDFSVPCHDEKQSARNLAMVPERHRVQLEACELAAVPGYKRIRNKKQTLELRFDDVSGCLRTATGGSSRQYLVIKTPKGWRTRVMTPREAARLMGAPESYWLPASFNSAYKAMGDAVAVPVAAFLARHLLYPLCEASNG